uniref:Transcription initiation factor TFIID subunit 2 n=1 Tax=Plectus sambesii TaxID=2011161 RepID=A0A914UPH0_9BILA
MSKSHGSKPSKQDVQPTIDTPRLFKVLSQTVYISQVDLRGRSFAGFTEITVVAMRPGLREIVLNVGPDVQLPRDIDDGVPRLTVNDVDADYVRRDPFADLEGGAERDLKSFARKFFDAASTVDSEVAHGNGELVVRVPDACWGQADATKPLKIGVDFQVARPAQGVHFVCPTGRDGELEAGAHMFTYRSGIVSSTRHWLPCVDVCGELCLWRIEITCDVAFTAITSGELVETEYTPDMRHKTYQYQMGVPTSAVNIGFAVGQFDISVLPEMCEVSSFALPGLGSLVKHSAANLDRVFEFFEELLSCRFPFGSYKQVFVDQATDEVTAYAGLTIFSLSVLYHKKVVDLVPHSRTLLAHAVAQQFFGCFVNPSQWLDVWLMRSLSRYCTGLFIQRYFGNNEYLYHMQRVLSSVHEYESAWGPVFLRPLRSEDRAREALHFDPRNSETCSPTYADVLAKKGHFTIRMLEKRLGKEPLFQVLHKILTVSMQFSQQRFLPASWQQMTVSTDSFFRTVSNVTGQELPTFLEQWIYGGGHAHFQVKFSFNRKRNMVELEIKQEPSLNSGRQKYVGPLTVVVQELDGSFTHIVQIDDVLSRHDLQCHSKGRRQKKKKIPLCTGEELEIDLTNMDADSPVLWLRVDPDLLLVRKIDLHQPVNQWEYQLKYEKDVLAQMHSLETLPRFPSPQTRHTILDVIDNDNIFYRVRCQASFSLTEIANKMAETWMGPPAMINIFKKLYGSKSCPHIPRPNNFAITSSSLQLYFLMQAVPQAMARLRNANGSCLADVHKFLLGLIKYNDNSQNRYSDDYYRAALYTALGTTVTQPQQLGETALPDALTPEMIATLDELTLALNMDTLRPSFGRVVGISALKGIYQMQRKGHLPLDPDVFWKFAQPGLYGKMRMAALDLLVDLVHSCRHSVVAAVLERLLTVVQSDPDPGVRYHLAKQLSVRPPFSGRSSADVGPNNPASTRELVARIWKIIAGSRTDSRVRGYLIDAYRAMYGRGTPTVMTMGALDFAKSRFSSALGRPSDSSGRASWDNLGDDSSISAGAVDSGDGRRSSANDLHLMDDILE